MSDAAINSSQTALSCRDVHTVQFDCLINFSNDTNIVVRLLRLFTEQEGMIQLFAAATWTCCCSK